MSINKDFLNYSETKAHNQQMESHDIKKLSYSKGNCQLNEKQPTDWEGRISVGYVSVRRLVPALT